MSTNCELVVVKICKKCTHVHTHSVCVEACEKQLPPPLREHRKPETIQRIHKAFSSKLFLPKQLPQRWPSNRLDPQHIRQAGYL